MIISVEELKQFVSTDETDQALEFRIQALESFICKYTNNDFIDRKTGEKFFPTDVKMGAINMIQYDLTMRAKQGISSETISRHSVTYVSSNESSVGGYPKSAIGFLKPYIKARFGQGIETC